MFIEFRLSILILFLVGIVFLEIFLSKRKSKIPGLVLPIITLLFSFIFPLNMAVPPSGINIDLIFQILFIWLLANIPTIILFLIYFCCREKNKKKAVDKNNL